jgi:dTDP-4-amino-4,6-dideoxygalactose transaminase
MNTRTHSPTDLAIFGATPALPRMLPLGQHNFPSWERYEAAFRDIFTREYYTNHGPLAQALEARLAKMLNVGHAICVTNATIALALAAQAFGFRRKVAVPAFSFINTAQSLAWADVDVAFCDVSRETAQLTPETVEPLLKSGEVDGILAVNLWADAADVAGLQQLAESYGVPLYFDSAHAFACEIDGKPVGGFGKLEVISFHSSQIISATEGAVICTNDDDLAAHIRNIRSNYGMGRPVQVGKTGNGRLSEAQAAIALMNLDDLPVLIERNQRAFDTYASLLEDVPGLRLRKPQHVSKSNYQNAICEVNPREFGLSRDALIAVMRAENIAAGDDRGFAVRRRDGGNPNHAFPNTNRLCETILQLPLGAQTDVERIELIADVVKAAHRHARQIAGKLGV